MGIRRIWNRSKRSNTERCIQRGHGIIPGRPWILQKIMINHDDRKNLKKYFWRISYFKLSFKEYLTLLLNKEFFWILFFLLAVTWYKPDIISFIFSVQMHAGHSKLDLKNKSFCIISHLKISSRLQDSEHCIRACQSQWWDYLHILKIFLMF